MAGKPWGRPAKPDMSEEEASITSGVGARAAAWIIGDMRGAKTHRGRMVSHTWVLAQRKKRVGGRNVGPSYTLPLVARAEGNSVSRDIGDPEPHQGTGNSALKSGGSSKVAADSTDNGHVAGSEAKP